MILLAVLALSLFAVSLWWLSRPLRTAPAISTAGERDDLESLRDRLIAQLNELDAERADRGIDATVGREEETRLSAELAEVLKRHDVKVTFFLASEKTTTGGSSLDDQWAPWWRERAAETRQGREPGRRQRGRGPEPGAGCAG